MGDDIEINVTETTNIIEITPQPNDQIVDIAVTDNAPNVEINVTPSVIEINVTRGSSTALWGAITGNLTDQTDLVTALGLKADLVGGKVPSSQLPSYVDDVVEVANYAALPTSGETGKIYVTLDNNKIFRWSGSVYIEIAANNAIWGAITGTLSNQTDLQNALNAKEPTITAGTTSQYWRGDKSWQTLDKSAVGLGNVDNTSDLNKPISTATQTALDGKFDDPTGDTTQYIAGDGSLITFPVAGQSGTLVRQVRNTTGATLTKGTIVYISGATGNKPTVSKAIATGDSTSAQTFGMLQADLANNSNGYVVCVGDIIGLDTSGITEGTQLYLSSTTAGAYTTTKQVAPAHLVYIGVVTRSHPTQGQIEVKIQNGYELDEIHDVLITSKANNQFLVYESASSLWKNKSLGTILGGTSSQFLKGDGSLDSSVYALDSAVVKLSGAQTISGVKTFSNMPILSAASSVNGQIVYADASNQLKTITNFKYNDATGVLTTQLGDLGSNAYTSTAYQPLLTNPITGTGTTNYLPKFMGSTALGNSLIYDNGNIGINTTSPFSGSVITLQESSSLSAALSMRNRNSTQQWDLAVDAAAVDDKYLAFIDRTNSQVRMAIGSNGNVGIGTTSPSYKLDVGGTGGFVTSVSIDSSGTPYLYFRSTRASGQSGYIKDDGNMVFQKTESGGGFRFLNSSSTILMSIDSGGNVDIDTLGTGLVYSNSGVLTSTNPSDSRLKYNIISLNYGLNEILKLRPVSYNWKDDKINQGKQFGFIAQEVQEVMPELIKEFETEEGERLGLDKEGIYAALVNAIQEQQQQIEELKKLINK